MKAKWSIALSLTLSGCVSAPPQQEIQNADYGSPITLEESEPQVKAAMETILKDGISAIYKCSLGGKGWLGSGMAWDGVNVYGYMLVCEINGKNSYGAYSGFEHYMFVFTNGKLRRGVRTDGMAMQVVLDRP
jgi:hypothetical protein